MYALAQLDGVEGDWEAAVRINLRAVRLDPTLAGTLHLVEAMEERGDAAKQIYKELDVLRSSNADSAPYLTAYGAQALMQRGNMRLAKRFFRGAEQKYGRNPVTCAAKAALLFREGRLNAARATYERALAMSDGIRHGESASWAVSLAEVYEALGDLGSAVAVLEQAVTWQPLSAFCWYKLGRAYRLAGRPGKAREAMEKAVRLRPGYEGTLVAD